MGNSGEDEQMDETSTADKNEEKPMEEQEDKCKKCARSGFRARHQSLCHSCGDVAETESPHEKKIKRKCQKCSNKKWMENHKDFCRNKCGKQPQEEAATPEPDHVPIEEAVVAEPDEDDSVEEAAEAEPEPVTDVTEKTVESSTMGEDNKRKRKKKNHNKNKNKNRKRVKNKEKTKETENVEEDTAEKPMKDLGPLENLIKYLITQNTYT